MRQSGLIAIQILLLINVTFGQAGSEKPAADRQEAVTNDAIRFLNLPDRKPAAPGGAEFVRQVTGLSIVDREQAALEQILAGNVPLFSRQLRPLTFHHKINGISYQLELYVVADYMAIGSVQDYFYLPMTPSMAQLLADTLGCILPTSKMVDEIYTAAEVKLRPQPIPPSDTMTTVPVFEQHTDSIKHQFKQLGIDRSASYIISGTKKDVIVSNKIYSSDRNFARVVIYGWHKSANDPIQPVYNGHTAEYADYSHGVRLIYQVAVLNGERIQLKDILADSTLWPLLSDEGEFGRSYYP